ncbi:Ribokinase-like protein [Lichtheimia hyalospora FSU 10163]|nr:Ribokinase-like protein [Lichtheimia hyalospora FSU 10163]
MSALGPKITTKSLINQMDVAGIDTSTCLFRNEPTPSSYIIQSNATGSRTIISNSTIDDITVDEFAQELESKMTLSKDGVPPFHWVHFEGRNIDQAGDVVFFSKLFAKRRGYDNAAAFLHHVKAQCKPEAIIYCTWGSQGATCLSPDNILHHAPAIKVEQVMDAIGAGDTFIAGIIFSLLRNMSLPLSLQFACELASRKVAQQGFSGLAQAIHVPE